MRRLLTVFLLSILCTAGSAQLRIDFTADHSGGCAPLVVHFTTTGSAGNYTWSLGNGNSATIASPEAVYTDVGTYTVTLTVTSGGQTATATHTVTVYPPPAVSFAASAAKVCGTPVTFTGNTDGGNGGAIVGWLWDFGDGGTTSGGPSATHTYAQTGMSGASLTVTDNHGCTASLSQPAIVQVLPSLNTAFTADKSVLCNVTDPVQFTNTTTGPGTLTYAWDFGDGSASTVVSPSHSYAQKGNYAVKLTATSSEGCSVSYTQANSLNVANYSTDFSFPATTVCQGSTVNFTDNSNPIATSVLWSVDGTPVNYNQYFSYYFGTPGSHTVTLANTFGGCPQSVSKTVTIDPTPPYTPFAIATTNTCGSFSATFTDGTSGTFTRAWDLNYDGYASPTDFVSNGGNSISQTGYQYNTGYTVALKLTSPAGCTTVITEPVEVINSSPVIYEPNPGPVGACNTSITKTYAYTYSGTLQSFYWDFGDGTTSTAASPTHTWSTPGEYSTTLHYVDANGCSGQVGGLTTVISPPFTLDFTTTTPTVCVGTTVQFQSPSLTAAGSVNVNWDFGDGGDWSYPYHEYTASGVYTVTLTATNLGGCTASVTKIGYITVLPQAGSYDNHSTNCTNPNVVSFEYSGMPTSTVTWDFGDGQTTTTDGTVSPVQHSYAQSGTYYINVNATDGICSSAFSDIVHVLLKQHPVLSSTTGVVCASGSVNVQLAIARNPWLVGTGYYYDYTPTFYYADGTPFAGSVTFTNGSNPYNNGAFGWTLSGFQPGEKGLYVVTTSFGFSCTDQSNTIPLTIRTPNTPAFTIVSANHCYQQAVVLKDASTAGIGNTIVAGVWNFGDGQTTLWTGVGSTISHTYTDPGPYSIQLSITDTFCATTSPVGTGYVSVNGPKAAFSTSGTTVLLGNTLYLYNSTNTYGTTSVTYTWDFGDGSGSSNVVSPSHLYAAPGTYTVTLTASDVSGCTSVVKTTIVVQNFNSHFQTTASYVTSGKCPPVLAQFVNTSAGYSSVSWDFGDGTTAGNVNYPSHVYQQPGSYIVTLSTYGTGGLLAQYIDSVIVRQPSGSLTAVAASLCPGQPAQLQAKAKGALNFLFDYGDGSIGTSLDSNVTHTYAQPGSYNIQLVVVDTVGCAAAAADGVNIVVHPPPVVSVTPAAPVACLGGSVNLNASGGSSYSWSPATGLDQPLTSSPVASPLQTTTYSVSVVDANGCPGSTSVKVFVQQREALAVQPDSTSVCDGDAVKLNATGTDLYSWIGNTGGLSSVSTGGVLARPGASVYYTIVGSDVNGCFSDTATIPVTVLPVPTVDAGPDVEVLAGTPVALLATGSDDVVSWLWTPPDYLSCTDCAQPVSTPRKPETYIAKVTNGVGCTATDTVVVKLICEQSKVRIPEAFTPNGDGHNDRFTILGIGEVDQVAVFDRWGSQVFEAKNVYTADTDAQWDGSAHGQPAPAGVYVYFVQMTCPTGGTFVRKGTVVLIR